MQDFYLNVHYDFSKYDAIHTANELCVTYVPLLLTTVAS